jgi:predicted patatin/cPLA2 family phospholipase
MKIGVIDVGGGLRGSFGAGVFDYCMDQDIQFDYAIGVSAGAANVASYMAHQKGRNLVFYTKYFDRWQYMSVKNLIHTGSYIGLDYIYSSLSDHDGDYPLDWEKIRKSDREMLVVATDANSGKPHYFHKYDMWQDNYDPIKASCCVPVINRPYVIDGVPYYDGGLSDPVPYKKAFEDGCDKVVVILTRPQDFRRVPKNDKVISDLLKRHYPNASKAMSQRSVVYNQCVDECQKLEEEGKVLIIAPDSIGKMKTLTKDKDSIIALYEKGYEAGKVLTERNFL